MCANEPKNKGLIGENLKAAFSDTIDEGVPDGFRKLIDDNLRRAYQDTVEEGVPDRFASLLAQLQRVTGEGKR